MTASENEVRQAVEDREEEVRIADRLPSVLDQPRRAALAENFALSRQMKEIEAASDSGKGVGGGSPPPMGSTSESGFVYQFDRRVR